MILVSGADVGGPAIHAQCVERIGWFAAQIARDGKRRRHFGAAGPHQHGLEPGDRCDLRHCQRSGISAGNDDPWRGIEPAGKPECFLLEGQARPCPSAYRLVVAVANPGAGLPSLPVRYQLARSRAVRVETLDEHV